MSRYFGDLGDRLQGFTCALLGFLPHATWFFLIGKRRAFDSSMVVRLLIARMDVWGRQERVGSVNE
ncbi:hypothetical protein CA85_05920 [Allorhodopirellula solitaria]|uniref:Uncharacterized protein n=1 Tax=Allorhodopirellula solitaria TaxID=2527987 RepID=A0A5C5YKB8_9BACT|nr:hypothetical protein CA85_05920 [Allorhodopirellula solitaria]